MAKTTDRAEFEQMDAFGVGEPNAYGAHFTGASYLKDMTDPACGIGIANVTFEPGCRNDWHIHHAATGGGQMIICTAGEGWYQEEGKPAQSLVPGTIVAIPANTKHWHGAKKDSWFSHLAFGIPGTEVSVEWCERVSDEDYEALA